MMEKAYKPQFYKALNYSQQRDIIPKRRREWAGERVSQLEKVKLYEHPEDYKDMMYSLAVPESNPIYPTFRAETGQWRHPSFDTLMPSATPAEVTTTTEEEGTTGPVLILNFEGDDGATTWVEEAQDLSPYLQRYCEIDTAQKYAGSSSLLLTGSPWIASGFNYVVPGIGANFMLTAFARSSQWGSLYGFQTPYILDNDGSAYIYVITGDIVGSAVSLEIQAVDRSGNTIGDYTGTISLPVDTWHRFDVLVSGRSVVVSINDQEIVSWTAIIDEPLLGLDFVAFWKGNGAVVKNGGLDSISIVNI